MPPRRRMMMMTANPFIHTPTLETHILKSDTVYIITSFTSGSAHILSTFNRLDGILRGHRVPYHILDAATNPYAQKVIRIWGFKRRKAEEAKQKKEEDASKAKGDIVVDTSGIEDPKEADLIAEPHLGTNYLPLLYVRDRVIGIFDEVLMLNEKHMLKAILWPNGIPGAIPDTTTTSVKTPATSSIASTSKSLPAPAPSINTPRDPVESAAVAAGIAAAAIAAKRANKARETRLQELQQKAEDAKKEIAKKEDAERNAEKKVDADKKAEIPVVAAATPTSTLIPTPTPAVTTEPKEANEEIKVKPPTVDDEVTLSEKPVEKLTEQMDIKTTPKSESAVVSPVVATPVTVTPHAIPTITAPTADVVATVAAIPVDAPETAEIAAPDTIDATKIIDTATVTASDSADFDPIITTSITTGQIPTTAIASTSSPPISTPNLIQPKDDPTQKAPEQVTNEPTETTEKPANQHIPKVLAGRDGSSVNIPSQKPTLPNPNPELVTDITTADVADLKAKVKKDNTAVVPKVGLEEGEGVPTVESLSIE